MDATAIAWPPDILDRMVRAVEKVRERLLRTARILDSAGVPYAVVGGNAVAAWVEKVDEGAVRNTRDVDIIVHRRDLEAVKEAMEADGFVYGFSYGIHFFLDGPNAKPSDGIHLLFFDEKVKDTDPVPTPTEAESERGANFQVMGLEGLVRMKLVANRDKDRTHLRDMITLGLVDESWTNRYPKILADRLQHLFDTPGG